MKKYTKSSYLYLLIRVEMFFAYCNNRKKKTIINHIEHFCMIIENSCNKVLKNPENIEKNHKRLVFDAIVNIDQQIYILYDSPKNNSLKQQFTENDDFQKIHQLKKKYLGYQPVISTANDWELSRDNRKSAVIN